MDIKQCLIDEHYIGGVSETIYDALYTVYYLIEFYFIVGITDAVMMEVISCFNILLIIKILPSKF